jgi:hypothetical protein
MTLPLRVMVLDAWDEVRLEAPATTRVSEIKRQALERSKIVRAPESYVLKHRGWEVGDDATLAEAGIEPLSPLIVLPRRKRPVR